MSVTFEKREADESSDVGSGSPERAAVETEPVSSLVDEGIRLAAIVQSSFDCIIGKDLNGIIQSWNHAAERLFGYKAEEIIGQSILTLIPADHQDEETRILQRIRAGERVEPFETVRQRQDGTKVFIELTISPIRNVEGRIVGASKIARDITARKETEHRIRMLMREVNHRVKNQYSVILSMIRETFQRSESAAEFEQRIRERIMALANSHDVLVLGDWKGATVAELLAVQLKPFGNESRVSCSGPLVTISPNAVQHFGIAFHELATNSAKYGALSSEQGHIEVTWGVRTDRSEKTFVLNWRESAASEIRPASSRGFGCVVLERVTPQSVGGSGKIEFRPEGLSWELEAPLSQVEASVEEVPTISAF